MYICTITMTEHKEWKYHFQFLKAWVAKKGRKHSLHYHTHTHFWYIIVTQCCLVGVLANNLCGKRNGTLVVGWDVSLAGVTCREGMGILVSKQIFNHLGIVTLGTIKGCLDSDKKYLDFLHSPRPILEINISAIC